MALGARGQRKQERLSLRATARQVELIDEAAAAVDKTRTDFMLDVAVQESKRILADRRTFTLGDEERDAFLMLLDRPVVEKPRLRALFERGSVLEEKESQPASRPSSRSTPPTTSASSRAGSPRWTTGCAGTPSRTWRSALRARTSPARREATSYVATTASPRRASSSPRPPRR